MDKKIISVIVAYNAVKDIEVLLYKLLEETIQSEKVIVVDNSDDMIQQDMLKVCSKDDFEYLNIEYIKMESNKGSAGGFALGIKVAYDQGADWVWLHDQDGFPAPSCLEFMLEASKENMFCIVTPNIKDFKDNPMANFHCKRNIFYNTVPVELNQEITMIDAAGSAGVLIHKSVINLIGCYDAANYFVGWEDYDYCYRAKYKGINIVTIKKAIYYHPNLDEKYNRNNKCIKFTIRKKIANFIPVFFGVVKIEMSEREYKAIYSIMFLIYFYAPRPVFYINFLYSIFRIILVSVKFKEVIVSHTIQNYIKNLKNFKSIRNQ